MSSLIVLASVTLLGTGLLMRGRADHSDCRGRSVCPRCEVPLARTVVCWGCREEIVDEGGAHLWDDHTFHPWCCPDRECRRIETEMDGGW